MMNLQPIQSQLLVPIPYGNLYPYMSSVIDFSNEGRSLKLHAPSLAGGGYQCFTSVCTIILVNPLHAPAGFLHRQGLVLPPPCLSRRAPRPPAWAMERKTRSETGDDGRWLCRPRPKPPRITGETKHATAEDGCAVRAVNSLEPPAVRGDRDNSLPFRRVRTGRQGSNSASIRGSAVGKRIQLFIGPELFPFLGSLAWWRVISPRREKRHVAARLWLDCLQPKQSAFKAERQQCEERGRCTCKLRVYCMDGDWQKQPILTVKISNRRRTRKTMPCFEKQVTLQTRFDMSGGGRKPCALT